MLTHVPGAQASVLHWTSSAQGMVTVPTAIESCAGADVRLPSEATNENASLPMKPAFGVYVNVPSGWTTAVPLAPFESTVIANVPWSWQISWPLTGCPGAVERRRPCRAAARCRRRR